MRRLTLVCWLAALLLVGGCYSTPASESELSDGQAPRSGVLGLDLAQFIPFVGIGGDVWSRDGDLPEGDPEALPDERPRVLLAELSVELVQERWSQPLPAGALVLDPLAVIPLRQLVGFGLYDTLYPEDCWEELPGRLRAVFVAELEKRGFAVVEQDPTQLQAWRGYETAAEDVTSQFLNFQPFGSDTGRVRQATAVPSAPGAVIVDAAGKQDLAAVDARLRREAGVEVLIRARLRVGVFEGLAALESGSSIVIDHEHDRCELSAERAILATDSCLSESDYLPIQGNAEIVDHERFGPDLERLVPLYLQQAWP